MCLRWLATTGTGVRRAAGRAGLKTQAHQAAFITEEPPNLPANGGVVTIVTPAAAYAFPAAGGFERRERFHRQQLTPLQAAQEQQDIAGEVGQRPIASLICAPAAIDLPLQAGQSLRVRTPVGMRRLQGILVLFKASHLLLELVNLSASTSLPAIKPASVQKEWPADLRADFIHRGGFDTPPGLKPHGFSVLRGW